MANNNNDDWLIGLGILAAAGIGYLVVRSIDEYKKGQVISNNEAGALSARYASTYSTSSYKPSCPHDNPVMCSTCKECIECNDGYGDLSTPEEPYVTRTVITTARKTMIEKRRLGLRLAICDSLSLATAYG